MTKFKVWDVTATEAEALEIESTTAAQAAADYCDDSMDQDGDAAEVYVRDPSGERTRFEVECEITRSIEAYEVDDEEDEEEEEEEEEVEGE